MVIVIIILRSLLIRNATLLLQRTMQTFLVKVSIGLKMYNNFTKCYYLVCGTIAVAL